MKKKFRYLGLFVLLVVAVAMFLLFAPVTDFSSRTKYIYVIPGANAKEQILRQLDTAGVINRKALFTFLANKMEIWKSITPGRFEIKRGENLLSIVRLFQKNRQAPVVLNIGRVRTKQGIARLIGKSFPTDSAAVMSLLTDSVYLQKFGVDTNTLLSIIIPKTYEFNWNSTLDSVLQSLKANADSFWAAGGREQKAADLGFSPLQVDILASIVEEETSKDDEKGTIASVYINRLHHNMALAADPTIKYALRDFSLKRILYGHLAINSPYNTYRNKGLPPGPICTPTTRTIDAVLNAPATDYLFFVSKGDGSGYHHFSATFAEHDQYAKQYHEKLDSLNIK
ncbi:MAG TPA: endolytic transglycosylase MltG [Chitinophagaceae bacterium]|nr:endolytic transglycosylase MltG [Chitinophagaceae bacterium]